MDSYKKMRSLLYLFCSLNLIFQFLVADCEVKSCTTSTSQNLWQPRAFSSSSTRELLMEHEGANSPKSLGFSVEYMRSFGSSECRLGSLPFWAADGGNTMTIGTNDGKSDVDGYQFGLGQNTKDGSITFTPKVQQIGGEMLWRLAQEANKTGWFFNLKLPLGAMMIDHKVIEDTGIVDHTADAEWVRYPISGLRPGSKGESLSRNIPEAEPDYKYGKLASYRQTVIRCGDIESGFGYDFWSSDKEHVGVGFKISCPTGNVPSAEFMMEPIFGRAGHWAVGGEIHGSYNIWEKDDNQLRLHCRADILHLTSGRKPSYRSFDLKANGSGSKYMLVQLYIPITEGSASSSPGGFQPAINITTLPVLSTIAVEGSAALMLDYNKGSWNASLTGEFWGRTRESLKIDKHESSKKIFSEHRYDLNRFAVLGRQIERDSRNGKNLYYCEPLAKIGKSENRRLDENAGAGVYTDTIKDARLSENRIPSSYEDALDIPAAEASRALTGKITGEVGYLLSDKSHEPHISVFGAVEVADKQSKMPNFWSIGCQAFIKF